MLIGGDHCGLPIDKENIVKDHLYI